MPIEVELKFKIKDLQELEYELIEKSAKLDRIVNQKDYYFSHPCRDFSKSDEALRIREDGSRNFLTYKGKKIDSKTKTRLEIETVINNTQEMINILSKLGFTIIAIVAKDRRIYNLQNIFFCLDNVESLGSFLEVEEVVDNIKKVQDTKKKIYQLLQNLNINTKESIRDSYLELLLKKKEKG